MSLWKVATATLGQVAVGQLSQYAENAVNRAPYPPPQVGYQQVQERVEDNRRVITLAVPVMHGREPDSFVRLETGEYVATWDDQASKGAQVDKATWHSGKKTHAFSILSSLIGVAAIAGIDPNVTPADGLQMLQNAGLASGFRAALSPLINRIGSWLGNR